MGETLYIKFGMSSKAASGRVTIGDVATVLCEDKAVQAKVRAIKLMDMPEKSGYREVFSVLAVVEQIQKTCPGVVVSSVGESDFIIEYDDKKEKTGFVALLKGICIGIVILFGSGFSIMTYNNDVGIPELFQKIYELVLGPGVEGNNILEISYSIGLTFGIVVFYNHFGGLKFGNTPTPIEIQMRSYESDTDNAIIDYAGRGGQEADVK